MRLITLAIIVYALFSSEIAVAGPQSPCYMSTNIVKCFKPIDEGSGGTGAVLTAVNGGLVYSDADSLEITSAGTASQWVLSGGAGAPTMSNTTTTGKTIDLSASEVGLTVQAAAGQAADILVVENSGGGTDYVNISSAGNVGIAETSPSAKLEIGSNTAANAQQLRLNNDGVVSTDQGSGIDFYSLGTTQSGYIYVLNSSSSDYMSFGTRPSGSTATEKMRITAAGNVQVGQDTGDASIGQTQGSASAPTYSFISDSNTGIYRIGADSLGIAVGGTEEARFEASGMYVKAASSYTIALNDADGSDDGTLRLAGGGSPGESRGATIYLYGNESADNGDLILFAGNDATSGQIGFSSNGTRRMTIDDDGSVSITDTGGNGGNVVHACTRRTSTTAGDTSTSTCSAGEIVTGGGCTYTGGSATTTYLRIADPDSDTSFRCSYVGTAPTSTIAYAICCAY